MYGIELGEDDKITMDRVFQRVTSNQELEKVMLGKNSDDDRKDFFIDIFKEEMGDYTGDRLDFYRKIMDKRIFPLVIESMYHSFSRKFR